MTGKTKARLWRRKRKLRMQDVCARYNISSKTVDRWVGAGILSKPMYINGIRYFDEDELDQRDQERMTGNAPSAA